MSSPRKSLPEIIITSYGAHKNMRVNQDEHNNENGCSKKLCVSAAAVLKRKV